MWARVVSATVGVWLVAAPAVLGYAGAARTNDRIVGPVAASLAVVSAWEVTRGVRWSAVALGAWLVVAPWLLAYGDTAAILNSTLVGLLLAALAPVGGETRQRFGGGWSALWTGSRLPPGGGTRLDRASGRSEET